MLQESQRQLILHSEFTALVFGRGEDFVLLRVNCDGDDSDISEAKSAGERGMVFCGVLALTEDEQAKADISPTNPAAVYTMMLAGFSFALMVADRMKRKQTDDFVRFAEGLHRLEDSRNTEKEN
jgi:hypothetical protein